jgi:hypothetical protein
MISPAAKSVPIWVRVVAGLVALLNLAFGLSGYFSPTTIFTGLADQTPDIVHAAYQFSARNTGIALALIIVSLVGVPESIAIVMIIRFLVEAQDLGIALLGGAGVATLLMPLAFIVVELVVIVTMFRLANTLHSAGKPHG